MSDGDAPSYPHQRRAAAQIVTAQTFGKLGDLLANPKTTLTWLMQSIGAPPWLVGLLVPIRESGSMLPQLWLTGVVGTFSRRKWASVAGCLGQAIAGGIMAFAAVALPGALAGFVILVALAAASLARALASIANKDVLGKTVAKGARGRVGGLAASLSGVVGAAGSLAAIGWGRTEAAPSVYAAVIGAAAVGFIAAGLVYAGVPEPADDPQDSGDRPKTELSLLWEDPTLGRFVVARALLLGSALGGPYLVLFGQQDSERLSTLASFVLASGLASATSSWLWGRLADRSGRRAMAWGGVVAAAFGAVAIALRVSLPAGEAHGWVWPALYFAFSVGYSGVRVGRKTYVVDVAGGDRRTAYVAASNTAIAVALLGFGAIGAALQTWSTVAAFGMFVGLTALGSLRALRLDDRAAPPG